MPRKKVNAAPIDPGAVANAAEPVETPTAEPEQALVRLIADVEFPEWKKTLYGGTEVKVQRSLLTQERFNGKYIELPFQGDFVER